MGTPDPVGLGRFCTALGGRLDERDGTFCTVQLRDAPCYLAVQLEIEHVPPAWSSGPGQQRVQVHLDVGVASLAQTVSDAVGLDARLTGYQPQEDMRVMVDPAGPPFCLYLDVEPTA